MTPGEIIEKWLAAYNQRSSADLIELYATDAEVTQIALGETLRGRQALLESFEMFFTAFPDNYTNPENILTDGDWVVLEWSGGGTFSGKLGENQPTGKSFTLRGCGFFKIVEGKIKIQRGYFDKYTWYKQINLPIS